MPSVRDQDETLIRSARLDRWDVYTLRLQKAVWANCFAIVSRPTDPRLIETSGDGKLSMLVVPIRVRPRH